MDEILSLLKENAKRTAEEIAVMTNQPIETVRKKIKQYEKNGIILQYTAVLNEDALHEEHAPVRALIEVKVSPQKDVGFDAVARRIYSFHEVKNCFLLSGGYDLLLVVEGKDIQSVAHFVASKLAAMDNVTATSTHFILKKYKENGIVFEKEDKDKRLNIML